MRNITITALVVSSLMVLCGGIRAQVSDRAQELQRQRNDAALERRMKDLHLLDQNLEVVTRKPRPVPAEPKLSAEARERVLSVRKVPAADLDRYRKLLSQPGTGIFKLFPDLGCLSKKIVRVTPECEKSIPMSSSFTFRTNGYSDETYHDIHYKDDRISSNSFFSQGIFGIVGSDSLEEVNMSHPAIAYLAGFQPATDPKIARDHALQFKSGVDSNGYRYADSIAPQENSTYVLRILAYRLENALRPLTDETTMSELMFHSLSYDKRVDVIIAFRILGRDENGGYTIVWKEIDRRDAGKIKFGKNQPLRDFRPGSKS